MHIKYTFSPAFDQLHFAPWLNLSSTSAGYSKLIFIWVCTSERRRRKVYNQQKSPVYYASLAHVCHTWVSNLSGYLQATPSRPPEWKRRQWWHHSTVQLPGNHNTYFTVVNYSCHAAYFRLKHRKTHGDQRTIERRHNKTRQDKTLGDEVNEITWQLLWIVIKM